MNNTGTYFNKIKCMCAFFGRFGHMKKEVVVLAKAIQTQYKIHFIQHTLLWEKQELFPLG